jgi:hypothetical protein
MTLLALVPSSLPIVCLWISVLRNAFLFGIEVRILQNWCTKWVKAQDLVLILVLFPLHFSSSSTGFVRLDRDQIRNWHEMEFYLVELESLSLFRKYQIPGKQVLRSSIAYMQNDCSLIWKSCSWANCFNCQNTIRFCTFLEFCISVRSCYDIPRDCCCVDWLSLWRLQDDDFFFGCSWVSSSSTQNNFKGGKILYHTYACYFPWKLSCWFKMLLHRESW